MDEAPAYVTGYTISKNPVQKIPSQFVNKTRIFFHIRKTLWFNCVLFSFFLH